VYRASKDGHQNDQTTQIFGQVLKWSGKPVRKSRTTSNFKLQFEIKAARSRHANAIRGLHFDVANYRLMKRGEEPRAKTVFEHLHGLRDNIKEMASRPRFDQLKEKKLEVKKRPISSEERLCRLREKRRCGPSQGPDLDH